MLKAVTLSRNMNCQKCRTPLTLSPTLQDLNPAALGLLVGRQIETYSFFCAPTLTRTGSTNHSNDQPASESTTRVPYPQKRKEIYNHVSRNATSPIFRRSVPAPRPGFGSQPAVGATTKSGLRDNPAMSFVMLTDSQVVPPQHDQRQVQPKGVTNQMNGTSYDAPESQRQPFNHQPESTARLFEMLSSRSDIDHPICTECTDLLLSQLQSRLNATIKERDAYIAFLKTLNNKTPTQTEVSRAQASLSKAKAAESEAFEGLLALEKEKATLDDEVATLEAESLALDDEEQAFWRSRNSFALTLSSFQNDRDAINAAYDHDAQQLERLRRTNVYNDTFCIGHDGFFGTINGLRLGRLPSPQNVDWSEINAAWGTAALLLATVADKLQFSFRGYRIKPMGSTSKIEKIEVSPSSSRQSPSSSRPAVAAESTPQQRQLQPKVTPLDLFSSGDLPLGRSLLHRRLDAGMVAFLECVRQLGEFVKTSSVSDPSSHRTSPAPPSPRPAGRDSPIGVTGGLKLPYPIRKDKIGDASIKLGVSQDEAWTRACKFALTCCKFLLAHASNVGSREKRRMG